MSGALSSFDYESSDSGPVGPQFRDALGLNNDESLEELWDSTKDAITDSGLINLKRVDRGGYGVVYRAEEQQTGNPRAVKVLLRPEESGRLKIFQRECRILDASEMPPGIAPKFYAAKQPKDAQPFLIQEWIEGRKLGDWLKANPDLSMDDRESLCRALFDTYSRLHSANLIHRDVSLGNIMISGRKIRLIDFGGGGRAKTGYHSRGTMTHVPMTEAFASPPVRNGERKQTIADEVHSIAKICYTVLTGQIATESPSEEWSGILKQAGVCKEVSSFLLPKMLTPPLEIAMQTQAKDICND